MRSNSRICPLGEAPTGDFRHPFVFWIGNDPEQFLDTFASDWRGNPELCKMRTGRIDHRSLPADEQLARAIQHQAALLLRCLGRNEPHVRPGNHLADGFAALMQTVGQSTGAT
jgi:hypothetical protein